MFNADDLDRIKLIHIKIIYILEICQDGIMTALEDEKVRRPAVLMHLTSIAEQFSKIKDPHILDRFKNDDIKGAIDTRNFIAHDYEGINLPIIEYIIRDRLPVLNNEIEKLIESDQPI